MLLEVISYHPETQDARGAACHSVALAVRSGLSGSASRVTRFGFGFYLHLESYSAVLLKPVPAFGGVKSQEVELQRIAALTDAGISVPVVLHTAKDYFVMKAFQGRPLDSMVSGAGPEAQAAFEQGLNAIAQVHAAGQYLSQGFARNMLVNEHALCFIDFEDDPLHVMTLEQAQARDYLLYLLSVAWLNRAMHEQWRVAWLYCKKAMNPQVRELIENTASGLLWMRHLPRTRKPFGRDALQLQALAEFMA